MDTSYSIRQATEADIKTIHQLAEAIWGPTYSSILSQEQVDYMFEAIYAEDELAKQLQEGQTYLLLFEQDKPVGFASYSVKDKAASIYKLNKIYLLPGEQGKGHGKVLLSAVEEEVKQHGAHVLDLNVNRYNKAKQFYERCGYQVHQQEDIPIGPYWMNDYVMRKRL
ncbi:GNAT family N-acetyltransferase [Pontibacter diazotrophicus]|uniref:GNAT family N-acetyltransferase n=1 Tax=Pontibacter diazotrophicus TaxID=1400979 RepID=A0A3D8LCZ1_9BACT|nr:GNAT family N-acetyltransferase [Pontibacter diazotrophicus]RDV15278.1 GNAT family N-acetyltransferase [Pontibacter diazotrophicus]